MTGFSIYRASTLRGGISCSDAVFSGPRDYGHALLKKFFSFGKGKPCIKRRGACATYKQQTIDRIQYTAGKDRNRMTKAPTAAVVTLTLTLSLFFRALRPVFPCVQLLKQRRRGSYLRMSIRWKASPSSNSSSRATEQQYSRSQLSRSFMPISLTWLSWHRRAATLRLKVAVISDT